MAYESGASARARRRGRWACAPGIGAFKPSCDNRSACGDSTGTTPRKEHKR